MRAALAVASTDGTLKPAEEQAVRQLCDELGLELDEPEAAREASHDEDDDEDEDDGRRTNRPCCAYGCIRDRRSANRVGSGSR